MTVYQREFWRAELKAVKKAANLVVQLGTTAAASTAVSTVVRWVALLAG